MLKQGYHDGPLDPRSGVEKRHRQGRSFVDSLSHATGTSKNTSGEKETDFFDCVAWRKTAEFVSRYFAKGRMIIVEGRMQNRSWTDKEGNKRRSTEIIVDAAHFGDSKPKGGKMASPRSLRREAGTASGSPAALTQI